MSQSARSQDELREELKKCDLQILSALEKRAVAARLFGEARKATGLGVPEADIAVISEILAKASASLDPNAVRDVLRAARAATARLEFPLPVVFAGAECSAAHAAARKRFGASELVNPTASTAAAFEEVLRGRASLAVVPYETMPYGPVDGTIRELIAKDLRIVACYAITEPLVLASTAADLSAVEEVYATPSEHAASTQNLGRTVPNARVIDVLTPKLALELASKEANTAVVTREPFAEDAGLRVLAREFDDAGSESVRYALVASRPAAKTGKDLTALAFSVADSPGALQAILTKFAEKDINLRKIESRPTGGEAWAYLFIVEIEGHATDRNVVTALEEAKRLTRFFKVMGSYAEE